MWRAAPRADIGKKNKIVKWSTETILCGGGEVTTGIIKKHLDSRYKIYNEQLLDYAERLYNYKQSISDGNYIIKNNQKDKDKYIKQHWKQISIRTIQRCIKDDSRIISNGSDHSIDEKARFETRYRRSEKIRLQIII